ncbi:hypothetical protein GTP46_24305 [Duganella sp. FT135W]|uniref:Lipoprotein n=1 Tax=Duganella flavida TaxID=2692175 RepID=A0A6L8KF90_9BURK|nr:hypothetical protein [Duganella flavida]MYM25755.1 hypothetical protein [Duganella flavida]
MKSIYAVVLLALFSGCAARSKVKLSENLPEKFPAHAGPVCMLKSPLPNNVGYLIIGQIDSSKRTYGSVSELLPLMAADARNIGADAIVNLNTGQKFGLLAWARPVGTGTAVKLKDPASINCLSLGGELR